MTTYGKKNEKHMLWEQLNSFVNWLLIAAAIVSAFFGDTLEANGLLQPAWRSFRRRSRRRPRHSSARATIPTNQNWPLSKQ